MVLIVTLLGRTVNHPTPGCHRAYSRAAVVVLAGASPAHQPEPSPSRHNCCPPESEPTLVSQPASVVNGFSLGSIAPSYCTVSRDIAMNFAPAIARDPTLAEFGLSPSSSSELLTPAQVRRPVGQPPGLDAPDRSSVAALRL